MAAEEVLKTVALGTGASMSWPWCYLRPDSDILDQVIFGGLVPAPERIQDSVRDWIVLLEETCQRRGLIPPWSGRGRRRGVVRVENRLGFGLDD